MNARDEKRKRIEVVARVLGGDRRGGPSVIDYAFAEEIVDALDDA